MCIPEMSQQQVLTLYKVELVRCRRQCWCYPSHCSFIAGCSSPCVPVDCASLCSVLQDPSRKTVIGLLDIYGFEVFYINRYGPFSL